MSLKVPQDRTPRTRGVSAMVRFLFSLTSYPPHELFLF